MPNEARLVVGLSEALATKQEKPEKKEQVIAGQVLAADKSQIENGLEPENVTRADKNDTVVKIILIAIAILALPVVVLFVIGLLVALGVGFLIDLTNRAYNSIVGNN